MSVCVFFCCRLIDLGAADVVHGHSSHHPLPIELYKGKVSWSRDCQL